MSPVRIDARIRARRIQIQAARARKRRRWICSGAAVIVLAVAAVAVARSPLFAITEVRLVGVSGEQAVELRELTPIALGENLLTADLGHVEGRLQGLPWIRTVRAVRQPPSAVEIRVEVRRPVAAVRLAGELWTVDVEGVVLAPGGKPGLVEIDAPNSVLPRVGTAASDAAVRNALAVHAALPPRLSKVVDRYDAPSERGLRVHLMLSELSVAPPGDPSGVAFGVWVRFGADERSDEKARVLDVLLEQVRRSSGRIAEIDVRAPDNPVLVPAGRSRVVEESSR
ncbi:MAG: cell division protein FtsQ/DivIB [Egibacteraceae bacterium]